MLCGADTKVPAENPDAWHSAMAHSACEEASHTQVSDHEHSGLACVPSDVMRVMPVDGVIVVVVVDVEVLVVEVVSKTPP
jgi:hypothetical protein